MPASSTPSKVPYRESFDQAEIIQALLFGLASTQSRAIAKLSAAEAVRTNGSRYQLFSNM